MFVYDKIKSARGLETSVFHSISLLFRLGMCSSLSPPPLREIQLFVTREDTVQTGKLKTILLVWFGLS